MSTAQATSAAYDIPETSKRPASAAEGRVNRANILAYYAAHPDQTNRQIAKAVGLAVSTTAGHLSEIRKARA